MLTMNPQKLNQVLNKLSKPDCLFCYGDCHARMAEQEDSGRIKRISGLNCIEIFLGKEMYKTLRREGAFFLLPEWTSKWERIFKELLGFSDQKLGAQFMNEMHTKFIYIHTGIDQIPHEILNSISTYFQLPIETLCIDLTHLENAIKDGFNKFEYED